ncbi:MAG: ADP-glyceromanno-heptose 6-epimerase [Nitrospinae bacterium]|nr:ADP-glyceromanno-heptose 6-epimerase [Nitrospinota bacterium]MZH03954.1 ADP-glyceromanno-heptose 6-epimerase [Nitrospinota bacterium]MZH13858.1 ADP-glyceromanno-heptose 6-epimerase [Nitrospinota bacterium]
MIVVTGGAGFIGSALVHGLNKKGVKQIWVVDQIDHPQKQENLNPLLFDKLIDKDDFLNDILENNLPHCDAILHMGACSSTTETNEAFLNKNNFEYTRHLASFCLDRDIRFIYASSAATYGAGENGYSDDESRLKLFQPLNLYGDSKQKFDLWAQAQGVLDKIVGLKYFNVYGPNEYHKQEMQSMVRKGFIQIRDTGKIRLFKSYKAEYEDGNQERDFLYIKDAVAMTLLFLEQQGMGGIFNVGSGKARNWNDLARALFAAMNKQENIEYIDMPEEIKDQYQYHTCSETEKIQKAGFTETVMSLEEGVADYVEQYLVPGRHLGAV